MESLTPTSVADWALLVPAVIFFGGIAVALAIATLIAFGPVAAVALGVFYTTQHLLPIFGVGSDATLGISIGTAVIAGLFTLEYWTFGEVFDSD
ncbi:MAG: hypothetical protein AAB395_03140 [Patescibacteria group bacterium]